MDNLYVLLTGSPSGLVDIFILVVIMTIILLPIIAIINILFKDIKPKDKFLWILLILVIPLIGSIVYFASKKRALNNKTKRVTKGETSYTCYY